MSTEKKSVSETPAADAPATSHYEAAQMLVEQLNRMQEAIPHFVLPTATRRSLSTAASLPPEFIELTSMARANHPALVRGDSTTPEEARDLMEFAEAYAPLADQFEAMGQFVRFTVDAAKSKVGYEALTTYALAGRLSRRPEHAGLVPHVADMRRVLRARVKRTKAVVARKLKQQREAAAAANPQASPADPSEEK